MFIYLAFLKDCAKRSNSLAEKNKGKLDCVNVKRGAKDEISGWESDGGPFSPPLSWHKPFNTPLLPADFLVD